MSLILLMLGLLSPHIKEELAKRPPKPRAPKPMVRYTLDSTINSRFSHVREEIAVNKAERQGNPNELTRMYNAGQFTATMAAMDSDEWYMEKARQLGLVKEEE